MADATIRTFLAIELSEAIRIEAHRFVQTIQSQFFEFRFINPKNWHLTLHFFGPVDLEKIEKLKSRLSEGLSAVKPFSISLEGLGVFPDSRKPRIFWIGVGEAISELSVLKMRIDQVLQKMNFEIESRHLHPHISIARSKGQITSFSKPIPNFKGRVIDQVQSVTLFKSVLSSQGAQYTPLEVISFGNF